MNTLNKKQWLLVIILGGYSVFNLIVLSQDIVRILNYRRVMNHNKIGYQFDGLQPHLKGQKYVGYFTDVSLKQDAAGKLFAQAQYMLTPVILDADNLNHPYVILVCRKPQTAYQKMKELGATPILVNQQFGVILAKR